MLYPFCLQVFQDNDLGLFEIQLEHPPEYEEAMVNVNRQDERMELKNSIMTIIANREMLLSSYILSYKVVSFFCLKHKISITTELIGFSISSNLHIGSVMVLGYFIFRFKS